MERINEVKRLLDVADKTTRAATAMLRGLLSPGDRIEYKYGNMVDVQSGTVIRVCAYKGLGVIVTPHRPGRCITATLKVPASALVPPVPARPIKVVDLSSPSCVKCEGGLRPWEDRLECSCGNVLVRMGGKNE